MDDEGACAAPLFLSDSLNLAPSFNVGFTPALTTGSRRLDFKAANEMAGLQDLVPEGRDAPPGYVWHHVDDFDPESGRATLELIEKGAHNATIPHRGSVSQWEQYNGIPYKR